MIKVAGTVTTGPGGIDVVDGLSLVVEYADRSVVTGSLDAGHCKISKRGRVRARRGRSVVTTFKPSKTTPGEYAFKVRLKVDPLPETLDGPLTLRVHAGRAALAGTAVTCTVRGRRGHLACDE